MPAHRPSLIALGLAALGMAGVVSVQSVAATVTEQGADPTRLAGGVGEVRSIGMDIPAERLNVRRVGPRFFPDPERAIDFGRSSGDR